MNKNGSHKFLRIDIFTNEEDLEWSQMSKYKISSTTIIGPIIRRNEDIVVNDKESNFELCVILGLNVKIKKKWWTWTCLPIQCCTRKKVAFTKGNWSSLNFVKHKLALHLSLWANPQLSNKDVHGPKPWKNLKIWP